MTRRRGDAGTQDWPVTGPGVGIRVGRVLWLAGWPLRSLLVLAIRAYRVLVGPALGGGCRFYPSCSHYAEGAIQARGALVGSALAAWRLLRCHPWSAGGIDHPPARRDSDGEYDALIHGSEAA